MNGNFIIYDEIPTGASVETADNIFVFTNFKRSNVFYIFFVNLKIYISPSYCFT